jgi:phage shock protein C
MAAKRLFRSRKDKVIAGLCGGLGKYFSIDPVIVRLIAIGLVLIGGGGIIVYLIGWAVVPLE